MKSKIIKSVEEMASMAEQWSFSPRIALVPTMGYLHEGHLSLVRKASLAADKVIVSIFVNPLQFGPAEDLARYPRDLERDSMLLNDVGASVIFAPETADITPADMTFAVNPGTLGDILCGQYRPGHFTGVCTIVTKLFQIVRPGRAIFGWKDAQQFLLLQKMVRDLNMPVELSAIETMREDDGVAMSSRNAYLTDSQRVAAAAIYQGLTAIRLLHQEGPTKVNILLKAFHTLIDVEPLLRLQYATAVNMDTLEAVDMVEHGKTLIAVAVFAGETRLIDNIRL